jgi:hypothetical protein
MLTFVCLVSLASIAVTLPRLAYAVAGVVGVVAAVAVASSAATLSVLIVAVALAVALADRGTVDAGYLERAPATAVATVTVRFLAPVWADPMPDAVAQRLLEQYSRAIASRHKARAAKYRTAWLERIAAIA